MSRLIRAHRGVPLSDTEAVRVYKLDPVASDLGLNGLDALLLDARGWPGVNRAYEL